MTDYIDYRNNVYSQFGEDGILEKIFKDLNISKGTCVEIGAGDGKTYSNTRNLAEHGWSCVWIEGDESEFSKITTDHLDVEPVHAMVNTSGLDDILSRYITQPYFDLLVIDIDGDDYHMWDWLASYKPKVVMIECNPTFTFNTYYVQKEGARIGSSALALHKLAEEKGYIMACFNIVNCIFVDSDLWMKLSIPMRKYMYLFHIGSTDQPHFAKDYDGILYNYGKWDYSQSGMASENALINRASAFEVYHDEQLKELL